MHARAARVRAQRLAAKCADALLHAKQPEAAPPPRRELQIITDDLHCTAVRITGGDAERLDIAAGIAAEAGLEVWFSPFTCDLTA